ncbi:ArdC family protein [Inquilinus sp. NPDC058860]|uniref:ArdC family protein n=1 Tax=Inquilinus sp. NPDC058860 TaxID=3346652 RepID=UPI0036A54EF5
MTDRADIYQDVTDRIVAALNEGVRPWDKPWTSKGTTRPLRHNGVPYRGINVLILWMTATAAGYLSPFWMTFKQAAELGGHVRKGAKATRVVYAGTREIEEEGDDGGSVSQSIRFMKTFYVFSADQIEGLPSAYYVPEEELPPAPARIEAAERFLANVPATVEHGGNQAFYRITTDEIRLPEFEAFRDAEQYYSTRAHETVHWTRHPSRLDRDFGRQQWGDEGYAQEELVAELGAAFLGADLGFRPDHIIDHAAYIASWLQALKNDKRFIFKAAAAAQRAVDLIHSFQPDRQEGTEEAAA